jgi:hypothetical protein
MAHLSLRTDDLHASPVRDMLNVAMRPEVISFAGGLPAAETFAGLEAASPAPRELLQYGPTEGEPELRARIAEELQDLGIDAPPERVLVLSGSQQGIDLAAKLVVDRGAAVAVEEPAYLAALQVFRFFGAQFFGLRRRGWPMSPRPSRTRPGSAGPRRSARRWPRPATATTSSCSRMTPIATWPTRRPSAGRRSAGASGRHGSIRARSRRPSHRDCGWASWRRRKTSSPIWCA